MLTPLDGPLRNGASNSPQDSDITRIEWDEQGRYVQAVHYPSGLRAKLSHDNIGRLSEYTGPDGVLARLSHSTTGQIASIERAGVLTRFMHDAQGNTALVLHASGQRLLQAHDAAQRLIALADGQNNRIELVRDAEGQLMQARLLNPNGSVAQERAFTRDPWPPDTGANALHALAQSAQSDNLARPGLPVLPHLALNHTLQALLHRWADPSTTPPAAGIRTATDSQGRTTTHWHDDFGRLVRLQSPVTGATRYWYNATGHLMARVQADGSRSAYLRDAAGRVVGLKSHASNGQLDEDATIAWGPANKPVLIKTLHTEDRFAFDAGARLVEHTQIVDGQRWTIAHRYDSAGQREATTLPGGQTLRYRYRGSQHPRAGLLESVWLQGPLGVLSRPVAQGMNSEADSFFVRRFDFGNGLTHEVRLDAQGRLAHAGNAQVGQTRLSYSPGAEAGSEPDQVSAHQARQVQERAPSQAAQHLASRAWGGYARWLRWSDATPMAMPVPGSTAAQSERITHALLHPAHDTLGRQTLHMGPHGAQRLTYDSLGRLVQAHEANASPQAEPIATYRYNLFGQRIAKTVATSDGRSTRTTYYMHDGARLVAEADDQGAVGAQYVWANAQPLARLHGGEIHAIHVDHRNAPLALTDEARRVLWSAQVHDFGHAQVSTAAGNHAIEFNLRLSNQYFDAETGLHQNTHRYYDPVSRRYTSADPLGLAVGPDLHAFALNRPHTLADPLGLQPRLATDAQVSAASYEDKLHDIVTLAVPLLPGEIGAALLEMVQPENLAIMGAIFGIWAASQFTPVGWVADLALLGMGIWFAGSGVFDLFNTFVALHRNTQSARCLNDLQQAAQRLANGFVTGTGQVAGGLTGTWGLASAGAFTRIASGIRTVTDFGRRQVGRVAGPPTTSLTRPTTADARYPSDMSQWTNADGSWRYPPNDGFSTTPVRIQLPTGTLIDRFGRPTGSYLSPVGTPFGMRALPPSNTSQQYFVYRVVRPLDVDAGPAAAWFGQQGTGTQYRVAQSVQWLLDNRYLELVRGPL